MTIINISRPYWSDGSYWVNYRYKVGTSFGQGRVEASNEKSLIELVHKIADAYNYDYTT